MELYKLWNMYLGMYDYIYVEYIHGISWCVTNTGISQPYSIRSHWTWLDIADWFPKEAYQLTGRLLRPGLSYKYEMESDFGSNMHSPVPWPDDQHFIWPFMFPLLCIACSYLHPFFLYWVFLVSFFKFLSSRMCGETRFVFIYLSGLCLLRNGSFLF